MITHSFRQPLMATAVLFAHVLTPAHMLRAATIEEEISESRTVPEPLMWVGTTAPTQTESQDLYNIVTNFPAATWQQDLLDYIGNHPNSPWTPSVRCNLAILCRECGEYSPALNQWSNAWQVTKAYTNGFSKTVGDTVLAHWSQLLTSLGRTNQLKPLFEETAGRQLDRVHLQDLWDASKEGYQTMLDYPELAYRCGTFALINVGRALQLTNASLDSLKDEPSSGSGFSMSQLANFAQQRAMGLVAVVRTNGTNLVIPSVVHWKQNHYAAITAEYGGAYWVKDPTFGGGLWMRLDTLNLEASGKFMVPSNQVPSGWRAMTQQEMDATWGQGQPNNIEDWKDHGCDITPGGRGAPAKAPCPPCVGGMPRWWVTEPYINLWVADEPLSYTLSTGERFAFRFTYKQRRTPPTNQRLFPTRTSRTENTVWEHNWLAHVQLRDPVYEALYNPNATSNGIPAGYKVYQNWEAVIFSPGGGVTVLSSNAAETVQGESRSKVRLEFRGSMELSQPAPGALYHPDNYPQFGTNGVKLVYPDGSEEWYTLVLRNMIGGTYHTNLSSSALTTRVEAMLTHRFSPDGRRSVVAYDAPAAYLPYTPAYCMRVRQVIDPDGRTNTFNYYVNYSARTNAGVEPLQQIIDPYGRSATLGLSAPFPVQTPTKIVADYRVDSMTDAENNTTSFLYHPASTNTLLTSMTTPYGTTAFVRYQTPVPDPQGPQGTLGGHNRVNRSLAVQEPDGARHLFMYRYDSPTNLPASFPTNQVPAVSPLFLLDNGGSPAAGNKSPLYFRNSFYWGPKNYPLFNLGVAADLGYLTGITSNQFRFARWRHWLDSPLDEATVVSDRVSLERAPAPSASEDGHITWFSYRSKYSSYRLGPATFPSSSGDEHQLGLIADVLPNGTTRYEEVLFRSGSEFLAIPYPREVRSTYTKTDGSVGLRTNLYVYHANKTDLYQVYGADGDIEQTYLYNTNHQVVTYSNAVAETYSFNYDPVSRNLTSISTPSGLTVTYNYYPTNASDPANRRMLASVTESPINRANSFTYQNGLPNLHTNELGLRMGYAWDGLDRLTRVDYFDDSTFVSNRYAKLDLAGRKDRLNNWTLFQYDAAQRLTAVTNANTNVTRLGWCGCGALESITNALGQATTFAYDQQSRRTSTLHADQSSLVYGYDPLGRLTKVTDGAGHALDYSYNNQGLLAAVSNAFGRVFGVVYDREDRPIQITDAEGVTVTNAFDNLDRITNRAWPDGGQERTIYSFAGTNVTSINPLGHTNRTILDAALRLLWRTNANLEVTKFGFNPAGQIVNLIDGKNQLTTWNYDRFGRVTNKIDALTRELFRLTYDALDRATNRWTPAKGNTGYAFDPVGNLKSITYSNASPVILGYSYDAANRLTNMTDTVGATRFTYTAAGQLDTEDGPWTSDTVSRSYLEGQRSTLTLQQPAASAWSQTYGYDAARRLQSLTSPAGAFAYDYTAGTGSTPSDLFRKLTLPNGALITNAFDALAQLTNTTLLNQWRAPVNGYGYTYDKWGQRTNIARALGAARSTLALTYDPIGQLKTANAYETNGIARLNEKLGYAYDAANNLQRRTNATLTQTFTPDAANQLSTATRSGTLTAAGFITRPATNASVNGQGATLYTDQTFATSSGLTLTNNGTNTFTVIAQSTTGLLATNTLNSYLPSTLNFAYDANGNLTNDGVRSFQYDTENQMTNAYVANAWRSEFRYDGLNRRRHRKEYTWSGGAWVPTNEVHYVYDGLLVLQERDSNNIPVLTYTRGLDLSGSLQGAGGIGGLLALSDQSASASNPTNYFYHADGSGNITALMNSKNEIVAKYLYDPFGNPLAMSGPMAPLNRLGFSSKERHTQSGLILYEFRPYDPNLQRWLNQDPIGERGGINLYRFVRNSPVNDEDPFGLTNQPGDFGWGQYSVPAERVNWDPYWPPVNVPPPSYPPLPPPPLFPPTEPPPVASLRAPDPSPFYHDALLTGAPHLVGTPEGGRLADMNAALYSTILPLPCKNPAARKPPHFSGTDKPWTKGATPDSIYTHIDPKTGKAVQNAVYDSQGNVIGHVDFKNHGPGATSGHGHTFPQPGNPASGHGPGNPHIPNNQLPPGWDAVPPGVQPHTPIGK
jgi:RHS repeat-associated protein